MSPLSTIVFSVFGSEIVLANPGEDEDTGIFYGAFSCQTAARAAIDIEIRRRRWLSIREPYRYIVYMSKLDEPVRMEFYDIWNFQYSSPEEGRPFWVDYNYDSDTETRIRDAADRGSTTEESGRECPVELHTTVNNFRGAVNQSNTSTTRLDDTPDRREFTGPRGAFGTDADIPDRLR